MLVVIYKAFASLKMFHFCAFCSIIETEINMSRGRGGDGVWSHGVEAGTGLNVGGAGRVRGHFRRVGAGAGEKITPRAGLYYTVVYLPLTYHKHTKVHYQLSSTVIDMTLSVC